MSVKRIVDTAFWTDEKVSEQLEPIDRYCLLYLLTNPHTTQLGIYQISPRVMAFETGYSEDVVKTVLDRLQNRYGIIRYSERTKEVAIINYLKYSVVKGGRIVEELLEKELRGVKDAELAAYVYDALSKVRGLNDSVLKILPQLLALGNANENVNVNGNGNENENENENENGKLMLNDIYKEGENASPPPQKKPGVKAYGEYGNVWLTDAQLAELKAEFPRDWEARIKKLSCYMASKGTVYRDALAAIRVWEQRDREKARGDVPENVPKKAESYDPDEFYQLAVARSYRDKAAK